MTTYPEKNTKKKSYYVLVLDKKTSSILEKLQARFQSAAEDHSKPEPKKTHIINRAIKLAGAIDGAHFYKHYDPERGAAKIMTSIQLTAANVERIKKDIIELDTYAVIHGRRKPTKKALLNYYIQQAESLTSEKYF
jgi:hypothetical protein